MNRHLASALLLAAAASALSLSGEETKKPAVALAPAPSTVSPPRPVRRAPTPEQKWVNSVYQDLLGRPADPAGLAQWSSMLARGTSRRDVAAAILGSAECRSTFVQGLYRSLLGRPADPGSLNNLIGLLAQGGTYRQVHGMILSSPEYFQAKSRGGNAGFVDALYQDVLGRPADPAGRDVFVSQLGKGTPRAQVVNAFLSSPEALSALARKLYQQFLHRDPDPNGLQFFTKAFGQGQREENVIATLLSSPEYFQRATK